MIDRITLITTIALTALIFVAFLNIVGLCFAEEPAVSLPGMIRFQGKLRDTAGSDLNETVNMTFKLYNTDVTGTPLWSENQIGVVIEEGMLDVVLGEVNEIELAFDEQYYLGIEVGQDGEMTPRFKITSVPYAFTSEL